jgi:hypothetical protein
VLSCAHCLLAASNNAFFSFDFSRLSALYNLVTGSQLQLVKSKLVTLQLSVLLEMGVLACTAQKTLFPCLLWYCVHIHCCSTHLSCSLSHWKVFSSPLPSDGPCLSNLEEMYSVWIRFIGLWWWYINVTMTILDVIYHPALYLRIWCFRDWLLSPSWDRPNRKN